MDNDNESNIESLRFEWTVITDQNDNTFALKVTAVNDTTGQGFSGIIAPTPWGLVLTPDENEHEDKEDDPPWIAAYYHSGSLFAWNGERMPQDELPEYLHHIDGFMETAQEHGLVAALRAAYHYIGTSIHDEVDEVLDEYMDEHEDGDEENNP